MMGPPSKVCPSCKKNQQYDAIFGYANVFCPDLCVLYGKKKKYSKRELKVRSRTGNPINAFTECSTDNCKDPVHAKNLCERHYYKYRRKYEEQKN